jgi:transposase-like protein
MNTNKLANLDTPESPKRRRFSAEFKLKILDEIDSNPNSTGLILRREGIYSSNLVNWRRWREKMGEGRSKGVHNENARLKRENERLKLKLKKAETIIDLQKKISQIIGIESQEESEGGQ